MARSIWGLGGVRADRELGGDSVVGHASDQHQNLAFGECVELFPRGLGTSRKVWRSEASNLGSNPGYADHSSNLTTMLGSLTLQMVFILL